MVIRPRNRQGMNVYILGLTQKFIPILAVKNRNQLHLALLLNLLPAESQTRKKI
jgi:hypothetical protein